MKLDIKKGKTSKIVALFISDSSKEDGSGLAGLVFNSAGLVAKYKREGESGWTTMVLVTATEGTWTTLGFKEDAEALGNYELGIPNAALASGADWVRINLYGATNMAFIPIEIQLVDNIEKDTYDIVSHGTYGNEQLMRTSDKGGRTVTTNSDKTGYALADPNLSKADVSGLATSSELSTHNGVLVSGISAILSAVSGVAVAVWNIATSTLTTAGSIGKWILDNAGGSGGLTAQQTRDAMKLAPGAGSPADNSIDGKLDTAQTDLGFLKGALGFNSVLDDFDYDGNGKVTGGILYVYDTRANTLANGKTAGTGLQYKQLMGAVIEAGNTTKLTRTDEVVS